MVDKKVLDKKIQVVSYSLIAIFIAVIWIIPGNQPGWMFFLSLGAILVGMNIVRLVNKIKMSVPGFILGIIALLIGLGSISIKGIPIIPLIIIIVALVLIFDVLFGKGKAG
jgi:hypothetical protein